MLYGIIYHKTVGGGVDEFTSRLSQCIQPLPGTLDLRGVLSYGFRLVLALVVTTWFVFVWVSDYSVRD